MMKIFVPILLIHQVASFGSFAWFDRFDAADNDNNDDMKMFSNMINNWNLDISLDSHSQSLFDGSFNSNFDDLFADKTNKKSNSQPLYLMIEWIDVSPKKMTFNKNKNNQNKRNKNDDLMLFGTSSMFILEETDKVNGDTWRYTVQSDGDNEQTITEQWSSNKMYLCSTTLCDRDNGLEMTNIDGSSDGTYAHLVATSTTVAPKKLDIMEIFNDHMDHMGTMGSKKKMDLNSVLDQYFDFKEQYTNYDETHHWMKNMAKDYMSSMFSDDDNDEQVSWVRSAKDCMNDITNSDNPKGEIMNKVNNLWSNMWIKDDESSNVNNMELSDSNNTNKESENNLIAIEMSMIMVFIMICGVLYAAWRYLLDRREAKREMDSYLTQELLQTAQSVDEMDKF